MQNIDQCIKPALLIVNFFYINVKIDLTFLTYGNHQSASSREFDT